MPRTLTLWALMLSFLAATFQPLVAQDAPKEPAAAAPAADDKGASKAEALASVQEGLAMRYQRFENTMLQVAEYLRKSDPERADLLVRAIGKSKETRLPDQFSHLINLLKQDQLGDALDEQEHVIVLLQGMLELLQSEDRKDEIEKEKARIRDLIKDVNRLIEKEDDLRADTERKENPDRLKERQDKIAGDAQKLLDKIDGQDAAKAAAKAAKANAGKTGKQANGQPKDGEPKEGDDKPKDGDDPKDGDPKDGDDQNKDGNPKDGGKPKDGDSPGKDGPKGKDGEKPKDGAKPKDGEKPKDGDQPKDGDKPKDDDMPKDGAESSPSDGNPKDGKKGKPSKGKPSKSKPGSGKPGEPPESDPSDQDQKPGDESEQDEAPSQRTKTPGSEEIQRAKEDMERAIEELKKKNHGKASDEQDKAIAELMKAKEKLEEILRQLREEEKEMLLAALEARFRDMLQRQMNVYNGTVGLHAVPESQRTDRHRSRAVELARSEDEIALLAAKALTLLKEEGSSIAFPEAVEQMRDDMLLVVARLERFDVADLTQGIEKDIIEALEELIEALQQEMEKAKDKKQNPPPQDQQQQDPPLVDQLAELKTLRALQHRVNRRTKVLGREVDGEQAAEPDVVKQLREQARRQEKIQRATYDLSTGKNK